MLALYLFTAVLVDTCLCKPAKRMFSIVVAMLYGSKGVCLSERHIISAVSLYSYLVNG